MYITLFLLLFAWNIWAKEYEWKMQYFVVMRIPVNPLQMRIRHNQTPWIWLWMDEEKILSFLTAWKPINEKNCFLKNVMSLSWFINISDEKWLDLRPSYGNIAQFMFQVNYKFLINWKQLILYLANFTNLSWTQEYRCVQAGNNFSQPD